MTTREASTHLPSWESHYADHDQLPCQQDSTERMVIRFCGPNASYHVSLHTKAGSDLRIRHRDFAEKRVLPTHREFKIAFAITNRSEERLRAVAGVFVFPSSCRAFFLLEFRIWDTESVTDKDDGLSAVSCGRLSLFGCRPCRLCVWAAAVRSQLCEAPHLCFGSGKKTAPRWKKADVGEHSLYTYLLQL